jgi:hypothetical protein
MVSRTWKMKTISIFVLKANHNKDYSVVKTFKAAQVVFFIYLNNKTKIRFIFRHSIT